MEVTPYRSNNEKFVLVELINCTMISKDFFEDFVLDKNPRFTGPAPVIQGCDPSKRVKSNDLGDELDNVIKNCVYIGIVGKYLVLLKEKWKNWEFLSNTDKLKLW